MQRLSLFAAAGLSVTLLLAAAEPASVKEKEAPTHVHRLGKNRVFYQTEGLHAVSATDVNRNEVPDQAEDIATQTKGAYLLFVDTLGFPDPFTTDRYRGAAFLDISVRSKDALGSNGKAYDELQYFNRPGDPPKTASLSFAVAANVQSGSNLTPAHEFFHVMQNSVCHFKNRWYTEGTARWSERGLGAAALGPIKRKVQLPLNDAERTLVFGMAYEASEYFWNPLALADDREGVIPEVPPELAQLTYADGSKVLKDRQFTGWRFMREVLRELDKADDVAFREQGLDRWSESNQRSEKNDSYILHAVMDAIAAGKESGTGLKR